MSEYQYYEFLAIDQPLSDADMRWLRSLSTRADITSTRFVNEYHWGDFKGDPVKLMKRCFDAHVYVSNFGYCRFIVKLPVKSGDAELFEQYCTDGGPVLAKAGDSVLLEFAWDDEPDSWEPECDGPGWMASLAPLRDDLLEGNCRSLYLAWLLNVQCQGLDDEDLEPPVPPGLQTLSAACAALADFLQLDRTLVEVAADKSTPPPPPMPVTLMVQQYVHDLPVKDKDDLLARLLLGDELQLRHQTIRKIREQNVPVFHKEAQEQRRTVGELFSEWDRRARDEQRRAAGKVARERARREKEEARKRQAYLHGLAKCMTATWKKVESLIRDRTPQSYDRAVTLLMDLRDAATVAGKDGDFVSRLQQILERHARKSTLIRRIEQASLR